MTRSFVWTRFDTLGVALHDCPWCHGGGLLNSQPSLKSFSFGVGDVLAVSDQAEPCSCVLREIFRACFEKFREIATSERPIRAIGWSRKDEEYMADFLTIAKRALREDLHRVFRIRFLLGASEEACIDRMDGDRGAFFHAVSQIELRVGRALRETQPYALFPIEEYFRPANAKR
jgi:hypothetical protein